MDIKEKLVRDLGLSEVSEADVKAFNEECAALGDTVPVRDFVMLRQIVMGLSNRVYELEHRQGDLVGFSEEPNEMG